MKKILIQVFFVFLLQETKAMASNYHLVGWLNAAVPGAGQSLLGNPGLGALQAGLEISTFYVGFQLSQRTPMTLDGVPAELPSFKKGQKGFRVSINTAIYANFLQEFGIKYHMVNTFLAYRDAAQNDPEASSYIDQKSTLKMFLEPFQKENLFNPWVYIPIAILGAYTLSDYFASRATTPKVQGMTTYSNFLYALYYGGWQPHGSGVPEEMFYRGFLQNEFYHLIASPFFAIPMSTLLFALSHEPGDGRITAAVAGSYMGFLAHKYHGNLGPGTTIHFWGGVLLGIEAILLNHDGQRITPPASFYVQIGF